VGAKKYYAVKQYSYQVKDAMLQKLFAPSGPSITELAAESGISDFTLRKWKKECGRETPTMGKNKREKSGNKNWSNAQKLDAIIQTTEMSEEELGIYLRKNGLFSSDLENWKNKLSQEENQTDRQQLKSENFELKKQIKEHVRDLRRKEKALAEATALLVMKKKAELIWGKVEDDES